MLRESLVEDIWRQDVLNEDHPTLSLSLVEFGLQELGRVLIAGYVPGDRHHEISFTEHQNNRFCRVWNELAKRSTTKKDDIAAILAALSNLSSGEVLKLRNPKDQMKALMKSQYILPQALLVAPTMLPTDLMEWVPDFPNSHTSSILMNPESVMQVTEDGFVIQGPASLFAPLDTDFPLSGYIQIQNVRENMACRVWFTADCEDHGILGSGQLLLWFMQWPSNQGRWVKVISSDSNGHRVKLGHVFGASGWVETPLINFDDGTKLVAPWPATTLVPVQPMIIDLPVRGPQMVTPSSIPIHSACLGTNSTD